MGGNNSKQQSPDAQPAPPPTTTTTAVVVVPAKNDPTTVTKHNNNETTTDNDDNNDDDDDDNYNWMEEYGEEYMGGMFRGVATALRKLVIAKGPVMKQTVRAIGQNRPLAFASEGAVAGESMIPRVMYYGAWGLSGMAIMADIYNKQDHAPPDLQWNTVLYWTTFHIPASLVVPAMIIHRVVHQVEALVHNPTGLAKTWTPKMRSVAPVGAALLSIIPIVPIVDYTAESIMEPTLGKYLGLTFDHHHHHHHGHHDHNHTHIHDHHDDHHHNKKKQE